MAKRPPSQSQRGIEIARRHCHDRRQAARDERIADRAEQQHLGDRLEKLDYALHAEDALDPVQRVDAIALELHRLAAPAERAEHRRSEEHTSELQSLMSISYAVFCLK